MIQPVYISDIIGEVTAKAKNAIVKRTPNKTLLQVIQENEKATHEDETDSLIQDISFHGCHKRELIETLIQKDQTAESQEKKYPLIFLVRDFEVIRGKDPKIYGEVSLNIIIAHHTNSDAKITEREAKVFKPVLYPIYLEFMRQLPKHPMIADAYEPSIKHTMIERSYWGRNAVGGTDRNKLSDYVDAIEIQNLQLKINFKTC